MTFKVTILGSGSAQPVAGRHHSAHAVNVHEQFYLVDCGEGTQSRMARAGISPLKLGAVFISHLHGDHIYGLFPLISTMGLLGRRTPLDVFGPRPLGEVLECHMKFFDAELPFEVRYHEVDSREHALLLENKVLEVWSVPLRHRVPTAGYLFREKQPPLNIRKDAIARYGLGIALCAALKRGEDLIAEGAEGNHSGDMMGHCETRTVIPNAELTYRPYNPRSYAYLSDTLYSAKAAGLVKGVDLMYHEATFGNADRALARQTGHSTALQAARAAKMAEAKKLLIGHFSGRYKDEQVLVDEARTVFPNTEAAQEGHTYKIDPVFSPWKQ